MYIKIKIIPVVGADYVLPIVQTKQAACADVAACLNHVESVKMFDSNNVEYFEKVDDLERIEGKNDRLKVIIRPNHRAMIPTGLRFIIKHGYQFKMVPRSGLSLKYGITLINSPGTIDSDYTKEIMVLLHNTSNIPFACFHHDRIAQMELRENMMLNMYFATDGTEEELEKHEFTSNRSGGFGSTGISS